MQSRDKNAGFVLLATVIIMTMVIAWMAAAFAFEMTTRATIVRKQLAMEQAMHTAEAGMEAAVGYIVLGGATPVTLTRQLANGTYAATIHRTNVVGRATLSFAVRSVGTVAGMERVVAISGGRQKTWADYALWSHDSRQIYFKSGEKFYGPVHSNSELWFSGSPEFFAPVTSAASTYGGSIRDCIFHQGFDRNVPTDSMADVDFSGLKAGASLTLRGETTIVFQGTNMVVSNGERGWNNVSMAVPRGVVYVENSGSSGSINVRGMLNGRTSLVAEHDIRITGNLTYAEDPNVAPSSDDALGLISGRNISVERSFPNGGRIYAHMMATGAKTADISTDGSFGVVDYWSRRPSGYLTVHGGIVQYYRGAVGTKSGDRLASGFEKNYTFDTRFSADPPPEYPTLSDRFSWDTWKEGSPSRCP